MPVRTIFTSDDNEMDMFVNKDDKLYISIENKASDHDYNFQYITLGTSQRNGVISVI